MSIVSGKKTTHIKAIRFGWVFVLAGLSIFPQAARAQRLAIIKLKFRDAPPTLEQRVRQELRELFLQAKLTVVPQQELQRSSITEACTVGPCLAALQRELKADWALTATLVSHGSNYHASLTVLETTGGTVLAQSDQRCAVCTYGDAAKLVRKAAKAAVAGARKTLRSKAWLELSSDPTRARVDIDGVTIGQTPIRRLLSPGPHWVALFKDRRWIQQRVFLIAGRRKRVMLHLGTGGPAPAVNKSVALPLWPAWLLSTVGVGAAASGAVLWGVASSCQDDCRRDRSRAGVALVASGAAAIVASGVWIIVRGRLSKPKAGSKKARTTLLLSPAPGRLSVGVLHTF